MVILAGALDPVIQKSRWYHYMADTWPLRSILPDNLNVATKEMLHLPGELILQKKQLANITMPSTFIQGKEDWLVPMENIAYIKKNLTKDSIKIIALSDQGHFLPWEQYELVKTEIITLLGSGSCS